MKRELIIRPFGISIGDHLLFSPIPRIAKNLGYQRVYISNLAVFANPIYRHYLWECNPYVDGFKDGLSTLDPFLARFTPDIELYMPRGNIIDYILRMHRLNDKKLWHTPEIYFKTTVYEKYNNATIFDPSFVYMKNEGYGLASRKEKIRQWLTSHGIKVNYQITSSAFSNVYMEGIGEHIECSDFLEYSSIVRSCKRFYCMYSGCLMLAVALGKYPQVFYFDGLKENRQHGNLLTIFDYLFCFLRNKISLPFRMARKIKTSLRYRIPQPKMFQESEFIVL